MSTLFSGLQQIPHILTQFPVIFYISVFIFCLLVGSFLNVVIHRLPIMMKRDCHQQTIDYFDTELPHSFIQKYTPNGTYNLVKPDSTCPKCQHEIRAWENIPLLSYIFLNGACSQCKTSISIRYPLVELATGLIGLWTAMHFGVSIQTLVLLFASFLLISMIMIDVEHMLLPDDLTLGLLWLGLIVAISEVFIPLPDAIIGAIAGYFILWSIYWCFKLVTGKEGMGYGDFKLLAALGAFVGWQHLIIIILLSSIVGIILGLLIPHLKRKNTADNTFADGAIPFGPFLGVAGWLTIFYGDTIQQAYLQWAVY